MAPSPPTPAGFPSVLLYPPSPSADSCPPSPAGSDIPLIDTPVSAPIVVAAPLIIPSESAVTQSRQIAISEGIISLVDANITPEIATAFHRQMLRSVHRDDPAHTAISGEALHKLDITIQSDGAQTFIPTSFFPDWTHRITCTRLSEIVLHYFGPRINTTQTIEQAFKAIPFIYDIFNKQDEQDTYCEMAILLQLYERKRGAPFSADLNASLAHILEKRITSNSKIHQDFLVRKAQDRLNKIPESPLHSMKRLCLCNDAVRQAARLLDSYPTTRHFHSFKGSSLTGTFVTIAKDISRGHRSDIRWHLLTRDSRSDATTPQGFARVAHSTTLGPFDYYDATGTHGGRSRARYGGLDSSPRRDRRYAFFVHMPHLRPSRSPTQRVPSRQRQGRESLTYTVERLPYWPSLGSTRPRVFSIRFPSSGLPPDDRGPPR